MQRPGRSSILPFSSKLLFHLPQRLDDQNAASMIKVMLETIWDLILGGPARRAHVEEISKTINIPSQPKVMIDINSEFLKKEVDFSKIASLVSRDVGLSAKLLKVANSPLFAPKLRIESIDQALLMLGARQFKQTILASALRQTMEGNLAVSEMFWHHSETTGFICDLIARKLHPELAEYAYMAGLFHDCAIPILIEEEENYAELVPRVMARDRMVAEEEELMCEIEHCSLGLVMTRSWSIPVPIIKVVRAHHSDDFTSHNDPSTTVLHVILAIAENYYLFRRSQDEELFGLNPNPELLIKMCAATGWSETQILSIKEELNSKLKL